MINDHLSISDYGLQLLQKIETLRLQPYDDQTGKQINAWCRGATIGWGHLIQRMDWEKYKLGIDHATALDLMRADLAPIENAVRRAVNVPLTQQQFDALVIFTYNIGPTGLRGSTVIKLINDPAYASKFYPTLRSAWMAWNISQHRVSPGLTARRECEWRIWTEGIYQTW